MLQFGEGNLPPDRPLIWCCVKKPDMILWLFLCVIWLQNNRETGSTDPPKFQDGGRSAAKRIIMGETRNVSDGIVAH